MALTRDNDIAIHEAGHCIVAYLANDLFDIKFVTANSEFSKTHDPRSSGGLRGSLKKKFTTLSFEDHDLMVLIFFAGMAADDVNHCNGKLSEELYDNSVFASKMNSYIYSGDCYYSQQNILQVLPDLGIAERAYTISCQKLLHQLFSNPIITPVLIALRCLIENSPLKTLSNQEVHSFLDKTELKRFRDNEWTTLMTSRISLIKKEVGIDKEK